MGLEAMHPSRDPEEELQQLLKLSSVLNCDFDHSMDISNTASLNLPLVSGH